MVYVGGRAREYRRWQECGVSRCATSRGLKCRFANSVSGEIQPSRTRRRDSATRSREIQVGRDSESTAEEARRRQAVGGDALDYRRFNRDFTAFFWCMTRAGDFTSRQPFFSVLAVNTPPRRWPATLMAVANLKWVTRCDLFFPRMMRSAIPLFVMGSPWYQPRHQMSTRRGIQDENGHTAAARNSRSSVEPVKLDRSAARRSLTGVTSSGGGQ